ncbi:hypothetical protein GW537_11485 [Piscirickettsia salmonis]|nr:hypothetical protein GW538_11340 [Piscirickettsia salmonis]QHS29600.1 hypothetical protein GW537_11485 [Piscirickettsia salmonis]
MRVSFKLKKGPTCGQVPIQVNFNFHNYQDLRIDNKIQLCTYKKLVFSVRFFHNLHEVLS